MNHYIISVLILSLSTIISCTTKKEYKNDPYKEIRHYFKDKTPVPTKEHSIYIKDLESNFKVLSDKPPVVSKKDGNTHLVINLNEKKNINCTIAVNRLNPAEVTQRTIENVENLAMVEKSSIYDFKVEFVDNNPILYTDILFKSRVNGDGVFLGLYKLAVIDFDSNLVICELDSPDSNKAFKAVVRNFTKNAQFKISKQYDRTVKYKFLEEYPLDFEPGYVVLNIQKIDSSGEYYTTMRLAAIRADKNRKFLGIDQYEQAVYNKDRSLKQKTAMKFINKKPRISWQMNEEKKYSYKIKVTGSNSEKAPDMIKCNNMITEYDLEEDTIKESKSIESSIYEPETAIDQCFDSHFQKLTDDYFENSSSKLKTTGELNSDGSVSYYNITKSLKLVRVR